MSEQQSPEATETEAPTATEPQAVTEQSEPTHLADDHPLVKTLAAQKDQIRDLKAQVSSATAGSQTAEERIAALEERAVKAERSALVKSAQAKHGISDEDAALFLTATDEDTLLKQAERFAARTAEQKKQGNRVPDEGRATTPAKGSKGQAFAEFAEDFFTR